MQGVNKVILIGNLGKDPEIRHFETGGSKTGFSLATSDYYRDKDGNRIEQTEWHNVVCRHEGTNKVIMKYLHKGSRVYVEGQIRSRQYTDKENHTRYITEIYLDQLTMLDPKPASAADGPAAASADAPLTYAQQPEPDALPF